MDEEARQNAEFIEESYSSIFEGHSDCRWDHFKHLDGEAMLVHVRDVVFPWLKSDLAAKGDLFARAMKDAVFLIPKGSLMVEMTNTVDKIYDLIAKEEAAGQSFHDVQGDIYEEFLSEIATAGKNGQFRTPRHIIQMMATMMILSWVKPFATLRVVQQVSFLQPITKSLRPTPQMLIVQPIDSESFTVHVETK